MLLSVLSVCVCVCLFVGLLPRSLEIACIDPRQTGSVGKGSDHLQLIKFWPSCAPEKGVCRAGRNFWAPPYYSQRGVCVSPSAFSFYFFLRDQTVSQNSDETVRPETLNEDIKYRGKKLIFDQNRPLTRNLGNSTKY